MKKETINIFLDSFDEDNLIQKTKDYPKHTPIILKISPVLFHFNLTKDLDLIEYNIYDYKIIEKHNYSFAINREILGNLVTFIKNNQLNILEIMPDLQGLQENPNDSGFKINFFTDEYKEIPSPNPLKKLAPKKILIISIFTVSFTLSLLMASYVFSKKSKILKSEIQKKETIIKNFKDEIITINEEKIPNFSNLFPKVGTEINNTSMRINICSNKSIFYEKLELTPSGIKISGFCIKLEDLFLFEQLLIKNNFIDINNDYIKNDNSFIEFDIDGKIGEKI